MGGGTLVLYLQRFAVFTVLICLVSIFSLGARCKAPLQDTFVQHPLLFSVLTVVPYTFLSLLCLCTSRSISHRQQPPNNQQQNLVSPRVRTMIIIFCVCVAFSELFLELNAALPVRGACNGTRRRKSNNCKVVVLNREILAMQPKSMLFIISSLLYFSALICLCFLESSVSHRGVNESQQRWPKDSNTAAGATAGRHKSAQGTSKVEVQDATPTAAKSSLGFRMTHLFLSSAVFGLWAVWLPLIDLQGNFLVIAVAHTAVYAQLCLSLAAVYHVVCFSRLCKFPGNPDIVLTWRCAVVGGCLCFVFGGMTRVAGALYPNMQLMPYAAHIRAVAPFLSTARRASSCMVMTGSAGICNAYFLNALAYVAADRG
eukprot:Lankesteria_metandrocarpae@DN1040_c0_g1_i1.p1